MNTELLGPKKHKPKGATFTIATLNDGFDVKGSDIKNVKADVVMMQETKFTDVRKKLPNSEKFGVHQNFKRQDQAGSAVVWNKKEVQGGKRGYANAVKPQGAAMLQRWANFTDVKVDGATVRMVSVHRPPQRMSRLWNDFDKNLAAFVKKSPHPVVIGMDANQRNPRRMAHLTGLQWHAPRGSIDGFLATRGIKFENVRRGPEAGSHHHPIFAKITVPPRLQKKD